MMFNVRRCVGLLVSAGFVISGALSASVSAEEIRVPAGGNLQAALNAAKGGDTILLEPGATYVGNFRLPRHSGTGFVTVRSAAADSVLPGANVRISPEFSRHLPKLRSPNGQPALATDAGAADWRLQCLEFQANVRGANDIIALGDGSSAQNALTLVPRRLILDRVYVHGDVLHGQKRGIAINGGETVLINSYVAEIKAIGQDSQAVGGWNGPGPFTIENNYLEAAGEVFMLGGADPSIADLVPADIVVRGNTLTRPLAWRQPILAAPAAPRLTTAAGGRLPAGRLSYRVVARRPAYDTIATSAASADAALDASAGSRVTLTWTAVPDATEYQVYRRTTSGAEQYWTVSSPTFTDDGARDGTAGTPSTPTRWQVKNLLELKNARRVRIERNLFSHNWQQAQSGVAILFTPRNQDGRCRWCVVEEVSFEYNVVDGIGAGINILGRDDEKPSRQTRGIVIRHNRFTDLSASWGGSGYFLHVQGEPRDITIDHNTIVSPDGTGVIAVDGPPVAGFRFTNNLALHNKYGIIGTNHGPGLDSIRTFFPGGVITRNVLAGGEASQYPGNECPSVADFRAQFVDYAEGGLALRRQSRWSTAATDGGPLGAVLP